MEIKYNGYIHDVDLESKITDAWHITEELSILNKAILDLEKPKYFYMHMIRGIVHINEVRMNCLEREWDIINGALKEQNVEFKTDWVNLYNDCLNTVKDLKVLCDFLEDKELTVDQTTNAILGLEVMANVKFENLFEEFKKLLHPIYSIKQA